MARLKGLYTRGKKYWFWFTHNGHQHRANLQTEDEALRKELEYRANVELVPTETIRIEITGYANEKFWMKEFSASSQAETIRVLNGFVDFSEIKRVRLDQIGLNTVR